MSQHRVDFYLLKDNQQHLIRVFICRLIEKAYVQKHKVFILCKDKLDAEALDELLWTFKNDSFIPHNLQGEGPEPPPPIQIGFDKEPRGFDDILINLTANVPAFFLRFNRTIEIIIEDEVIKAQGREKYRYYKQQGANIHTHDIQPATSD